MELVDPTSLAVTLDNLDQAVLEEQPILGPDLDALLAFLVSRVGATGSYRGLPAPTEQDYRSPPRLFTGEAIGSQGGTGCKLGFQATWALLALGRAHAAAAAAAGACGDLVVAMFAQEARRRPGMYCCCSCSVAGWRVLGVVPESEGGEGLASAMALLRQRRDGKGGWRGFPPWYSRLALSGLGHPQAVEELRYAVPALERAVANRRQGDPYARRRRWLAQRILERL